MRESFWRDNLMTSSIAWMSADISLTPSLDIVEVSRFGKISIDSFVLEM